MTNVRSYYKDGIFYYPFTTKLHKTKGIPNNTGIIFLTNRSFYRYMMGLSAAVFLFGCGPGFPLLRRHTPARKPSAG